MNCIGIDLGTCLSSVAVLENGMPVALNIETGSSQLLGNDRAIPSSVFIEEDGSIILGQRADNSRLKNPSRYRKEFKRDLGTNEPYHIGDFEILPEEIYREFFKYFKKKAEERLSGEIEKIVITHPAIFTGYKKEMIKKAAEMAGIINVELIDEPTAAAVYYSTKEKIENGEKLLVYDLGGGTFDVSLISKEGDGFRALTPPLGIERCGGVDFQRKIYDDIIDKFSSELFPILSKKDMLSKQISSMIEAESIKIKHNLSFSEKAEAVIMIPSTFGFYNYEILRNKFEAMIKEYVEATCRKIEDIVKNANIKMQDIDKVLLVGGSSRVPYVEEMIKKTTGKPICKDIDTELVVCYGAAIWGNRKRKDINEDDPIITKEQEEINKIKLKGKNEQEGIALYQHLSKFNLLKEDAISNTRTYIDIFKQLGMKNEAEGLIQSVDRFNKSTLKILVVGQFNTGKSTLINAFLGNEALETSCLPTTQAIKKIVNNAYGVEFIDTPGLNGDDDTSVNKIMEACKMADAVLYLMTATAAASLFDIKCIETLNNIGCKNIFLILNKLDLIERKYHEGFMKFMYNRLEKYTELGKGGIVAVSALSAIKGRITGNTEKIEDSRIDVLEDKLGEYLSEEIGSLRLRIFTENSKKNIDMVRKIINNNSKHENSNTKLVDNEKMLKKFEKDINYLKQQVNLMVKSRMEYLEENISKWSNDINISSKVSIINIKTSVKTIVEEMTSKLTVKIDTEQIAWCNTTLNPCVLKEINKLKDEFNTISSNNKIDSKQKYMVNIKPNISLSIINVLLPPMLMTGITPLVLLSISGLVFLPLSNKELMMAAIKTEFAKKVKEQFMGQKCGIEDRIAKEVVGYIDEAVKPIKTALEEID